MNREYYLEKNTFCTKFILCFRFICLIYFITSIVFSYKYLDNNTTNLPFYFYIFLELLYTIHLFHFIMTIYLNYNKHFSDVQLFIEWKKNIGLRKYYFRELIFIGQYICALIIFILNFKHFFDFSRITILYHTSIMFIQIVCICDNLMFLLIILFLYPYFCCQYKLSDNSNTTTLSITFTNIIEECSICMDNSIILNWTKTHCNHYFHHNCITKWKEINNTCPVCRANLNIII